MDLQRDVHKVTVRTPGGTGSPTAFLERGPGVKASVPETLVRLWQVAREEIRHQMARETFDLWLQDCRLLRVEGKVLVLGVRNEYAAEWINCRLKKPIERTVNVLAGIMAREGVPPGPYGIVAEPVKRQFTVPAVRSLRLVPG